MATGDVVAGRLIFGETYQPSSGVEVALYFAQAFDSLGGPEEAGAGGLTTRFGGVSTTHVQAVGVLEATVGGYAVPVHYVTNADYLSPAAGTFNLFYSGYQIKG